jgi:hypothetical protein
LNQHLQNPTNPITLAIKIRTQVNGIDVSSIPIKIYSSHVNFKVPGRPEYKTHITIINIPKLGVSCKTPEISDTLRELKRLCKQSTI